MRFSAILRSIVTAAGQMPESSPVSGGKRRMALVLHDLHEELINERILPVTDSDGQGMIAGMMGGSVHIRIDGKCARFDVSEDYSASGFLRDGLLRALCLWADREGMTLEMGHRFTRIDIEKRNERVGFIYRPEGGMTRIPEETVAPPEP